jgi:tetratricopeptide (TPR) repeat protein
VDKLSPAADRLVRADAAERLVPDEAYTQELAHLQHAFDRDSGNVEKAVALAAFCIRPALEIPVRLTTERRTTRVRVGARDLDRARRALDAAGKLAPKHHGALTQQALWMQARGNKQRMIQAVEHAMSLGALNFDLTKMYLDYYQELAYSQEQDAAALRTPTITYENRPDGRYRVTTPPSASALARAAQLEAQAKENRRKSMQPLQKLAAAQPRTPFGKLAEAEVLRMIGEYDRMVQTAEAALQIDPWHLEAREYLVEHCPKIGMNERALHHQDILDNLIGPSARITIGPVPNLLEQTRYTSALERLDAGQKKEPASGRVAALRAVALGQAGKSAEAEPAYRVAAAIEGARLGLLAGNVQAPWPADDAALALAVHMAWARTLEATQAAEAWNRLHALLQLAGRIPQTQWDRDLPATRLPTVFTHGNDKRRAGMTVRELVVEAQMTGAKLLASLDRLEEAARQLVACKETSEPMPWKPPVDAAAYPIIRKMGEARAAQIFPPLMMEGYRVMGRMGRHQETFRGTETIGKEGVRQQWIEARLKEIDQDLQLIQRSQTLTAMRKREQLMQERQTLTAELQQLRSQAGSKR